MDSRCSSLPLKKLLVSSLIFLRTSSIRSCNTSRSTFVCKTVFLLFVTALIADPKTEGSMRSKSSPNCSLIIVAPVRSARSSKVSCFVGPKPGRSIIFTLILPLTLLASNVWYGCCSISATINKDLFFLIACSKIDCMRLILGIGDVTINTSGLSSSAIPLSLFVTRCGDLMPESN